MTRPTLFDHILTHDALTSRSNDLFKYIANKQVSVRIGKMFSLHDAAEAQRYIESRKSTGKVLLSVNDKLQ